MVTIYNAKQRERIESFNVLRLFAFLGVYLSHSWLPYIPLGGELAVSIFLVLSGFLYAYRYIESDKILELVSCLIDI